MKKRKNVILSAITCFVSICMLMLGVYAASSPSVSIGGQVSYTARDTSVLVQGKTSKDGSSLVFDSVPSTKDFSGLTENTSGESYLDWTVGEGHDVEGDQLKAWTVGDLNFAEDSNGIKPIKLGFSFTNYSNFPVEATIVLNTSTLTSTTNVEIVVQTSDEIENNELTKTITLAKGETKSCEFVYKVIDDSKDASGAKIDVNVDFANANAPKPVEKFVKIYGDTEIAGGKSVEYKFDGETIFKNENFTGGSEDTIYTNQNLLGRAGSTLYVHVYGEDINNWSGTPPIWSSDGITVEIKSAITDGSGSATEGDTWVLGVDYTITFDDDGDLRSWLESAGFKNIFTITFLRYDNCIIKWST